MIDAQVNSKTERREYFRIDDEAILDFRLLSEEECQLLEKQKSPMDMDKFSIKAKLENITREVQPILRSIEESNPKLAIYLTLIDRKIDLLSNAIIEDEVNELGYKSQKVNLSTGGLSFNSVESLEPGSMIKIKLILLPEKLAVSSYAEVVKCSHHDITKDEYTLAVQFEYMNDEMRDLISRHVLDRDRALINSRKA